MGPCPMQSNCNESFLDSAGRNLLKINVMAETVLKIVILIGR